MFYLLRGNGLHHRIWNGKRLSVALHRVRCIRYDHEEYLRYICGMLAGVWVALVVNIHGGRAPRGSSKEQRSIIPHIAAPINALPVGIPETAARRRAESSMLQGGKQIHGVVFRSWLFGLEVN